jgi:predicted RNase H-like HicB family nuclease
MLTEYIQRALEHAHYEIIDDEEPYYGEIPELPGVWATGSTLEACRHHLASALEDWLLFSLSQGLSIPPIDDLEIRPPELLAA